MKYIHLLLLAFVTMLAACNTHNEEDFYTSLKIVSDLESQSTLIDWSNMTKEERLKYPRKGFVINSIDDFPDEPNMADLKSMDIDFNRYTLLVHYMLVPGYIKGHHYYWYYDNREETYVFQTHFHIIYPKDDEDPEDELFTYYRSAITVNKIGSDEKVSFLFSY